MPKSLKMFKNKKKALAYRNKQRKKNYDKGDIYNLNKGLMWTYEDIETIMAHKKPDRELARELNRSVRAIHMKRCAVKKGR